MILILTGTRPEIIKMAPVMRELKRRRLPFIFLHSGQHYSKEMDADIMADLKIKPADFNLQVGSGSHAMQTGKIMEGVEKICIQKKPILVVVHGDTNTTLAGALVAKKLQIKVAHVEAGLRSFDYKMPEEINRILVDRVSDLLFAPTKISQNNLLKEGVNKKKIFVVGNTVVDALQQNLPLVKKSKINNYILLTAHRAENVDDLENLQKLIKLINHAALKLKKKIIWPIHPRTAKNLPQIKEQLSARVEIISAVGYIDMLTLLQNAFLVMTDSGGVQEEAYILQKKLLTLRDSTERPETLTANFLIHLSCAKFDRAWEKIKSQKITWSDVFGSGDTSQKIVAIIENYLS